MSSRFLEFAFMRTRIEKSAPRALLSVKNAGDMKYSPLIESSARLALFASLGIDPERVVGIELKHTKNVAFVESKAELRTALRLNPEGFDGIVTRNFALVPSVTVADCMPIYLHCEHCGAFGVLHSGWKGTGILRTAIEGMRSHYGCEASDISVILGPSIGACCYAVDTERAALFAERFGDVSVRAARGSAQTGRGPASGHETFYFLDLLAANRRLAAELGARSVSVEHICTSCDTRLSSFRRDGPANYTRMLALAFRPFPN